MPVVERCLEESPDGSLCLLVHVQPGASAVNVGPVDEWRGRLRVAVSAPARDGDANAALIDVIARLLGLEGSAVRIESGAKDRRKRLRLEGIEFDEALALLRAATEDA